MTEQKKSRRQMLEEFIAKKPDDAFSRYGLALECSNTGDVAAADTHFRALTDQFPDYIPAYLMYAQMLARIERADDARQILTKGISAASHKGDDHARSEMESLLADLS
jgi:predicted Zn-dependent protease